LGGKFGSPLLNFSERLQRIVALRLRNFLALMMLQTFIIHPHPMYDYCRNKTTRVSCLA
jgi:hypothetical protein